MREHRNRIDVLLVDNVARQRADIRCIQYRVESEFPLHTDAEIHHGRQRLLSGLDHGDIRGPDSAGGLEESAEIAEVDGGAENGRRLPDGVRENVPLHAVIEDAETAADCGLSVAGRIVSEAK